MNQVELAKKIATEAHEGQFRWDKKTPYISHPAAVAKALDEAGYNDDVLATAWLHDVIEDCGIGGFQLVEMGVSDEVATAVVAMSKLPNDNYLEYILRVRRNKIARIVKRADIEHNMSCLDKKKGARYDKYLMALHILQGE